MKEICTKDAVGSVLCHDITQIIKDEKKGVLFKKGHVIRGRGYSSSSFSGKRAFICLGEKEGILHENEAQDPISDMCRRAYARNGSK